MSNKDWWRGAVIYQIYPRSYKDSNGDGIGDLSGITDKMDYIASLGVDGIWISPFFQSPMKDYGYDVSDYCTVDPLFGANEDFDILLRESHARGLRVIIDMVLSHTSFEHPWFLESRSSRDNAKADWYVWADPKPDGTPPNNWQSCFGGPAWTFDTRRGQYYLHNFLSEQPDLNFHNTDVQDAVLDACRFWLDLGIDGLRLDVVNFYFHDKELRANPPRDHRTISTGVQVESPYPYIMQQHIHDKSQPENFDFLRRLRALADSYGDIKLLGEIGDDDPFKLAVEYSKGDDMLHTSYSTHMMSGQNKTLTKDIIVEPITLFHSHSKTAWPSWAFCNHDVTRAATRWAKDVPSEHRLAFTKMLMALLCSLRGSMYIYQGEELGLPEAVIPYEKIQDPWGKAMWPEWQGRDGCRTPMPWHRKETHGGFSDTKGDTWLPIPDAHLKLSVNDQEKDKNSMLNFTREILKWRKSKPALIKGDMNFIETGDDKLLVFDRSLNGETIRCRFNLGAEERDGLAPYGYSFG
jgi:alpha-glucosidase